MPTQWNDFAVYIPSGLNVYPARPVEPGTLWVFNWGGMPLLIPLGPLVVIFNWGRSGRSYWSNLWIKITCNKKLDIILF